jgi:hypothetical protein
MSGGLRLILVIAVVALIAAPPAAAAWGAVGHKMVVERAVQALPGDLGAIARGRLGRIKQRALDPDLAWRDACGRAEARRHFFDLDLYGGDPARVERDLGKLEARLGKAHLDDAGVLPWRIEEMARCLVAAFQSGDRERALDLMGQLAHYTADLSQPFHLSSDYDGQSTGQRGIHKRYEDELVGRQGRAITRALHDAPVNPAALARGPLEASFAAMSGADERRLEVLAADRRAVAGTAYGTSAYYRALWRLASDRLVADLASGAEITASVWLWAWQEAGGKADGSGLALDRPAATPLSPAVTSCGCAGGV